MTRGILIAGNESALGDAVMAEAAKRVNTVSTAFIQNKFVETRQNTASLPEGTSIIPLSWNPGSPISARSLLLAAENHLEHVDDALLICDPPAMRKRPIDFTPSEIDYLVNNYIKGWFFLIREILLTFRARGKGNLCLVTPGISSGGKDDIPDLAGPSVAASFKAYAESVLSSAAGEPFRVIGFSSSEPGNESEFAAFIYKIIDDEKRNDSGKCYKFGKLSFFGR
ncbi:MAG: hypothetical protein LBV20_02105 [Treponema sp.]|jgi:hypothetical protein|nr:hypothetical protein [Treponema sp.]